MNSHSDKKAAELFPFEFQLKQDDLEDLLLADIENAVIVPQGKSYNKKSLDYFFDRKGHIDPVTAKEIESYYPNLRFNEIKNKKLFYEQDVRLLKCPLTNEFLKNPVVAPNGETYEKEAIIQYFKINKKLPSPPDIPESVQVKIDANTNIEDFLYPNLFMKSLMDYPEIKAFIANYLSQQQSAAAAPGNAGGASAAAVAPSVQSNSKLVETFVNKKRINQLVDQLSIFLQDQLKKQINETLKAALRLGYHSYTTQLTFFDSRRLSYGDALTLKNVLEKYFLTLRCYGQAPEFFIRQSESENKNAAQFYRVYFNPMDLIDALRLHRINKALSPDPRGDYGSLEAVPSEDMNTLADNVLDLDEIIAELTRKQLSQQQQAVRPVAAAAAAVAVAGVDANVGGEKEKSHAEIEYLENAIKTLFDKLESKSVEDTSESDKPHYIKLKEDFNDIFKVKRDSLDETAIRIAVDIVFILEAFNRTELDHKRETVSLGKELYKRYQQQTYGSSLLAKIGGEIERERPLREEELQKLASQAKPDAESKSQGFFGRLFSKKDKDKKDKNQGKSESVKKKR